MALLEIENLTISYQLKNGELRAVDDVSFNIPEGSNLGLVGESGCGKTTAAKSIVNLLPENGRIAQGKIKYKGTDLAQLNENEIRKWRWQEISLITQSAMNALNPVYRVGDQIVEAIRAHENISKKNAKNRAAELFDIVGLEKKRLEAYPHEMSGGMRQRAIIAMALALDPGLILADEPTTALDVVVQDKILAKIIEIQAELKSSMVFITHDISVVAETCDYVCVMYAGKVMEYGPTRTIFKDSRHPYTMGLRNAFPSVNLSQMELISIPGYPPDLMDPPTGCRFAERCPFMENICLEQDPGITAITDDHYLSCHFPEKYQQFRDIAKHRSTWEKVKERMIEGEVVY
ncbi:ABC transporter ATP-binding protein [Natranaerobius thermophilus]|uniref:Oligopeptide/dipeptide ABC transporter, ATPase subunit n=1 Tax=Natranaerobius thermophilus (strain ATCC BAA-1301 / DSM 18059 / JW/NM-WN-LF) TaxID=457570 RepID=B2A0S6_NATTJ|nr:ABC transporter ATP-binding protein [Natranaerobius thermophilus]ACB85956.1 oligopeptide/dipeptide ABC transporter, ATPase subunit [Natranaerobius thermophilus JW/NM-WN-LF]